MLWFTLWFLVILKIPILYLAYILWWAVKDPPDAYAGPGAESLENGGGPGWRPSRDRGRVRGPARGPHGAPERKPRRRPPIRTRAQA
jgi:hypothetical protein